MRKQGSRARAYRQKQKWGSVTRTVVSPAKETVEVVPDEEWLALTGTEAQSLRQWDARRALIGALWVGGSIRNKSGFATPTWHAGATALGYKSKQSAITSVMSHDVMVPAIERNIKGKRTYSIRLVALPESWFAKINAEWPTRHPNGTNGNHALDAAVVDVIPPKAPATPLVDALEARGAIAPDDAPDDAEALTDVPTEALPYFTLPDNLAVTSAVAMSLLSAVVDVIRKGTYGPAAEQQLKALAQTNTETQQLLAQRLDENTRLRKRLQSAGDEIARLQTERNNLSVQLLQVKHNLESALKGDSVAFVTERVEREIRRLMESKPAMKA